LETGNARRSENSLSSQLGIPSGPHALLELSFDRTLSTQREFLGGSVVILQVVMIEKHNEAKLSTEFRGGQRLIKKF